MSLESSRPKLWPTISHKPPFNIQLPNYEKRDGEGIPRRHPGSLDSLKERPDPSIGTLYDIVCFVEKKYGDALCMGSRKLLKTHVEKKMVKKMVNGEETEVPKEWTYYEMSGYEYMSYKEYKRLVDTVGCGLSAIGLAKDDYVQLYAATRYFPVIWVSGFQWNYNGISRIVMLIQSNAQAQNGLRWPTPALHNRCPL